MLELSFDLVILELAIVEYLGHLATHLDLVSSGGRLNGSSTTVILSG